MYNFHNGMDTLRIQIAATWRKVLYIRCHALPNIEDVKSNYKLYVYIVKHNYILGGMLFTIRKA